MMKLQLWVVSFLLPPGIAWCYSSTVSQQRSSRSFSVGMRQLLQQRHRLHATKPEEEEENCTEICPDPEEDVLLDRREATFAGLGALWAVSGSAFLDSWIFPNAAQAVGGTEAKIQLPNPLETMNDRSTKRCLVEALGNRECLVYEDAANKLYQGTDGNVLLGRIEKSLAALATVPDLVQSKKWSQVTGVITGPCGELIRTLGQLAEGSSGDVSVAKAKVQKIKKNLYSMQAAVERQQQDTVLQYHMAATMEIVDFVKTL